MQADRNSTSVDPVEVWITPTVERDYRRRNVFPSLRLEKASRFSSATGIYEVSLEDAEEILKDAETQRCNPKLPRGAPHAFTSLTERLSAAIKYANGLWNDPGEAVVKERIALSCARFEVGDKVLHFRDRAEYGAKAIIIDGYALYQVYEPDGPYIQSDGTRVHYQYGYAIREEGSDKRFFAPAHRLTRDDCEPSHLRLVWPPLARASAQV